MIRIAEILKKTARREYDSRGRDRARETAENAVHGQPGPLQRADGSAGDSRDDHRMMWDLWEYYQKEHPE